MPCYHPLTGYYSSEVNESGKRSLVFSTEKALLPVPVLVPCGQCIGCRLDRSLSWALRCVHEASLYDENCFITLTFDDAHLGDGSLKVADFQNFMKRFRQAISPKKVRFFHCGEYGVKFSRPHHHACIFGFDFPDKVLFKTVGRTKLYTSALLQKLWPFGFSTVGEVTFQSAAYVARYVLKKWSKENLTGKELYEAMQGLSDEAIREMLYDGRHVEYITMSRRPGIGEGWYRQFSTDIYPAGFALVNGAKVAPPKYYDSLFELDNPNGFVTLKAKRTARAQANPNNSRARLDAMEAVKLEKVKLLKRSVEHGD